MRKKTIKVTTKVIKKKRNQRKTAAKIVCLIGTDVELRADKSIRERKHEEYHKNGF